MCTAGNYCPEGSSAELECLGGTYETRSGSAECQTCPEGFYCPTGSSDPLECINGYCPEGVDAPLPCEDGYYSDNTMKRLSSPDDCPYCPTSYYCHSGLKQGLCDAGYSCDFGAISARDPNKICPIGHYCTTGNELPTRCPEGYYYGSEGATDVKFCEPCKAGTYCIKNDGVARVCPKGHICPEKALEPTPCYTGTYNPYKGKSRSDECLKCPMGSLCNARAIDDYKRYLCPAGHYCDEEGQKRDPKPCPAGTFRNETGAENYTDCWECPEGFFCNEGTAYPEPCDAGYSCPDNSRKEFACPAGTYCPALSGDPTACPAGFHCPTLRTDTYGKCVNGTYCPEGSRYETPCPAGYFGSSRTDNHDMQSGCVGCGLGQYSDLGSNTCEFCYSGYICLGTAITPEPKNLDEGGMICPRGFWCKSGSYSAIACPLGTYNPDEGAG